MCLPGARAVPPASRPRPTAPAEASQPERRTLLALGPRELLLAGFIESRGLIIVGAAFGLLWESGLFESTAGLVFGENLSSRSVIRQAVRGLLGQGMPSIGRIATVVLAFAAFVLAIRVLSMGWSLIRLWGFRLHRTGDDLGTEFGLITRVMATIPLRRIQTVTVRESPLHRVFKAASIRVDSAGGDGGAGSATKRESLAPIIRRADLPRVLAEVLPDVDVAGAAWRPVDPRGFWRALKSTLVLVVFLTLPFILMLRWWTLAWAAVLVAWACVHARLYVKHLGWAVGDQAVLFRSGWLWREFTVARFNKIQAVTLSESPFDRRARMASVAVDTAGAADASHRVAIPYLARPTADELYLPAQRRSRSHGVSLVTRGRRSTQATDDADNTTQATENTNHTTQAADNTDHTIRPRAHEPPTQAADNTNTQLGRGQHGQH